MKADLHIHTTASDGKFSPQLILRQAQITQLSHIAITDHDTVDGLEELLKLPPSPNDPTLIPGIEFSTDLPHNEVHILGYFIDITNNELRNQLKIIAGDRFNRAERMVHKLSKLGYHITYKRVLEIASNATAVGRPHVAAALMEQGYFNNIQDVFDTVLEKNKPGYVPHYKLTPSQVIEIIKAAGGIPVLAHPGLVHDDIIVKNIIKLGIEGLEIYHPHHSVMEVTKYEELAATNNLLITGGSDFHGIKGRFPENLGIFTIPSELITHLMQSRH